MSVVAVDFDGTVVTHEYPKVGRDVGAWPVLMELVGRGHQLVLFTMRSGEYLDQAVAEFGRNGVPLYGVNVNPTQLEWTASPKAYAHCYIDDAALGAPLLPGLPGERPFVDWARVRELLKEKELL